MQQYNSKDTIHALQDMQYQPTLGFNSHPLLLSSELQLIVPPPVPMQFDDIKDAIRALEDAHGKQLMGRTIAVQYGKPFTPRDDDRGGDRRDVRSRSPAPRRRDSPPPRAR